MEPFESVDCLLRDLLHLRGANLRLGTELQPAALEERLELEASIPRGWRGGFGARKKSLSRDQVPALKQPSTQVGRNLSAGGLVVGQEDGRPSQEPDRRRRVAAGEGSPAGRGEPLCGAGCKRARV